MRWSGVCVLRGKFLFGLECVCVSWGKTLCLGARVCVGVAVCDVE